MLQQVSSDLFDHLFETEKRALYGIPEYEAFKALYQPVGRIRRAIDEGAAETELSRLSENFNSEADRFLREGILSTKRLTEATRIHRRRLASRMNKYYRR